MVRSRDPLTVNATAGLLSGDQADLIDNPSGIDVDGFWSAWQPVEKLRPLIWSSLSTFYLPSNSHVSGSTVPIRPYILFGTMGCSRIKAVRTQAAALVHDRERTTRGARVLVILFPFPFPVPFPFPSAATRRHDDRASLQRRTHLTVSHATPDPVRPRTRFGLRMGSSSEERLRRRPGGG